jgi:hypothetical protein
MACAFNAVYANLEASIARYDDFSNEGVVKNSLVIKKPSDKRFSSLNKSLFIRGERHVMMDQGDW